MRFTNGTHQDEKKQATKAVPESNQQHPERAAPAASASRSSQIMRMQQTHGNAYVRRYLASSEAAVQRDGDDGAAAATLDSIEQTALDVPAEMASGVPQAENALEQIASEPPPPAVVEQAPSTSNSDQLLETIGST